MLIPEENRFNEAREAFDIAYKSVEEVFEFDRTTFWKEYKEQYGVTTEKMKRLMAFKREIAPNIPQRTKILDYKSKEMEAQRNDGIEIEDEENTSSSNNLVVANEKTRFLANLLKNIRNIFERIIGKHKEETTRDIFTPEDIDDETIDAFESDITGYNQDVGEKIFDIDKIIEECQIAYEKLLKASDALDKIYQKRINNEPRGRVVETKRDGPGILDDYRQSSWGIERICLDGFQNHLPADSKGTQCYLHFKVDGKWVDVETAKRHKNKITEVRFADNGVGFTADNLFYLHSTKTSEDSSAGQFGEGMKLASIAAVNLDLGLEFQSRNWSAIATSEEKRITNTRNNDEEEVRKKLVYDVSIYDGEPIVGSRTIFHTPTPEFIEYALTLPQKVMRIGGINARASNDEVELLDLPENGNAFVKGIYLKDFEAFFSYNFRNANVNPDRNDFHQYYLADNIAEFMLQLRDISLIEEYIMHVIKYTQKENLNYNSWIWACPVEFNVVYELTRKMDLLYDDEKEEVKSLWKTAFERATATLGITSKNGKTLLPYLKTPYEIPEYLKSTLEDYSELKLTQSWTEFFQNVGIPIDKEIIPDFTEETLETSLSLDYGKNIWNAQRIVLDAAQNHLPSDSKGTAIFLRFRTKDEVWHDYREFEEFSDDEIERIKISDNGIGYDSKNLGLLASIKNHSDSSGKWGEGLKMLSAAALRSGVKMELRSRDWIAIPGTKTEVLNEGQSNEKTVERLVYTVKRRIKAECQVLDDGDEKSGTSYGFSKSNERSSTTFVNPSPELIREFRNIKESVLTFGHRIPVASTDNLEVLETSGGKLYIRNILVPGNHQLKYSYHLKDFDIETRDRDAIKRDSMKEKMKEILENIDDENFIMAFLTDAATSANGYTDEDLIEFSTVFEIPKNSELADKWISVFRKKFGEKTTIRSSRSMDFNEVHQAKHLGIDMVTLPDSVARSLMSVRGRDGQKIISYEEALKKALESTIPVKEDDLTEHEKTMVSHLYKYNKILELGGYGKDRIGKIQVYDYPADYVGTRAGGFASEGNVMNISRETLNNGIIEAGDVFFHETGHNITGAEDADKMFRDYLTNLLSRVALAMLPLEESIEDNGVATDISVTDISNALQSLSHILSKTTEKEGEEHGDE